MSWNVTICHDLSLLGKRFYKVENQYGNIDHNKEICLNSSQNVCRFEKSKFAFIKVPSYGNLKLDEK